MSDDQHIGHVEYDDSDGESPNKESVISNETKSYELPVANTQEKEKLMTNQSQTITQLTQISTQIDELKLNQEPRQHVHAVINHQLIVNQQDQEIDKEKEENKKIIGDKEEWYFNKDLKIQQENVDEIINTLNDIPKNQEINQSEPLSQERQQELYIVERQMPSSQNQKEQSIEIMGRSKKETGQQISQQAVQDGSSLNNKTQMLHHELTKKKEEVHQNSSQFTYKQEIAQQGNNNETNSILDKAIYEQPVSQVKISGDRIKELQQYIQQEQKTQQHKNQKLKQKNDPPVQVQQVISQPKVQTVELSKQEKVESHGAQNDLSLSEQKIKPERRGTKFQNEIAYTSVKGRNNTPPKFQQPAAQSPKACKCVIM